MKKYDYLKEEIMRRSKYAMAYDSVDQEMREDLAYAYLQFLPVVSIAEQYDEAVKTVFLTAYGDANIEEFNEFCVGALSHIYDRYEGYISDSYKYAVDRLNAVTKGFKKSKGYREGCDWSNSFAEDLNKYLPWKYLMTGEVRVDRYKIYDVGNFDDITEYAKKQGFYPSQDK